MPYRPILIWSTIISTLFGLSQLLLVFGVNREMGIPDSFFCLGESAILSVLGWINTMPILVLAARLCPEVKASFSSEGTILSQCASAALDIVQNLLHIMKACMSKACVQALAPILDCARVYAGLKSLSLHHPDKCIAGHGSNHVCAHHECEQSGRGCWVAVRCSHYCESWFMPCTQSFARSHGYPVALRDMSAAYLDGKQSTIHSRG
jgi:hypothetical protein